MTKTNDIATVPLALLAGVFYEKKAAKRLPSSSRPYLARLSLGVGDTIAREFSNREIGDKNMRQILMSVQPGDVIEARRVVWNGKDDAATTAWFGVQADGSMLPLSREEAFDAVRQPAPASEGPALAASAPLRKKPEGFFVVRDRN